VKHACRRAPDETDRASGRKIRVDQDYVSRKEIPASLVDAGNADAEVQSGDWAIIHTRHLDLPALHADALRVRGSRVRFSGGQRLLEGHTSSRPGMSVSNIQRSRDCLTGWHPGVSGGGVLDQRGDLAAFPSPDAGRLSLFVHPAAAAEMLRRCPGNRRRDRPGRRRVQHH